MISKIFEEVINEAATGIIYITEEDLFDGTVRVPIRSKFNVVEDTVVQGNFNFYISNKDNFYKTLEEYIYKALEFYKLNNDENNIKKLLVFLWSNISKMEMNNIEIFVKKYIDFMNNNLASTHIQNNTSLGVLHSTVEKQSMKQETPYCFKSYFENDNSVFALPRISFGIQNNICYIYAIQNKDTKVNTDPKYNLKVKDTINIINSGIKKYRNITPSFVVALSNFLSYLKLNGINRIKVVSPLPIRRQNRELTTDYKINLKTMSGTLNKDELEKFKEDVINKKLNDDYNSTEKFINCFNRLKLHFDNIYLENNILEDGMIVEVLNLINSNEFLKEVVDKTDKNMLKCL